MINLLGTSPLFISASTSCIIGLMTVLSSPRSQEAYSVTSPKQLSPLYQKDSVFPIHYVHHAESGMDSALLLFISILDPEIPNWMKNLGDFDSIIGYICCPIKVTIPPKYYKKPLQFVVQVMPCVKAIISFLHHSQLTISFISYSSQQIQAHFRTLPPSLPFDTPNPVYTTLQTLFTYQEASPSDSNFVLSSAGFSL